MSACCNFLAVVSNKRVQFSTGFVVPCHILFSKYFYESSNQYCIDMYFRNTAKNLHESWPNQFTEAVQGDQCRHFIKRYNDHIARCCRESPSYAFWSSYLEMVNLLLQLIRATREGDWKHHLDCVRAMLPWYFAYDRINYSRYLL